MQKLRIVGFLVSILLLVVGGNASAQDAPSIVGYISYVGNDHNVYVVSADMQPVALTADATENRRYQFPTWSTDGRLAFFCCDMLYSGGFTLQTYVASPDMTAAKRLYDSPEEGYTYAYWSPANCADGTECRDLAVLVTAAGAPFGMKLIRQNGTETSARMVGSGAPFYISWNRDGQRMLWHRNNADVSVYDSVSDTTTDLALDTGIMAAPSWSPVDNRTALVLVEAIDETLALAVVEGDTQQILVSRIPPSNRGYVNTIAFSWSPDGQYLAYRIINRLGASPVYVVDTASGETVASTTDMNILAFFWSPDSAKIAYMTPGSITGGAGVRNLPVSYQPVGNTLRWSLLDVAANTARPLADFVPTQAMSYLLAYFDQYSQSHRIWSPDSRYLVYGETLGGGSSSVTLLDTSVTTPVPFKLADGEIGIWSYQ